MKKKITYYLALRLYDTEFGSVGVQTYAFTSEVQLLLTIWEIQTEKKPKGLQVDMALAYKEGK